MLIGGILGPLLLFILTKNLSNRKKTPFFKSIITEALFCIHIHHIGLHFPSKSGIVIRERLDYLYTGVSLKRFYSTNTNLLNQQISTTSLKQYSIIMILYRVVGSKLSQRG